jgi:hypothetical protein
VFVFIEISETGGSDFRKMAVGVSKRDGLPYETLTWLCSVSVTCNSLSICLMVFIHQLLCGRRPTCMLEMTGQPETQAGFHCFSEL